MKKLLIILVSYLANYAYAEDANQKWSFLTPGFYHEDQGPLKPGTGWLALTKTGEQWHLMPSVLKVNREYDAVVDDEGEKSGIMITSDQAGAIALLRIPNLKQGKINTPDIQFGENSQPLLPTSLIDIKFNNHQYYIKVKNLDVYLQKENIQTKLENLRAGETEYSENYASVLWAGDLDRDGSLDLIMASAGYNVTDTCVYLSSTATKENLVKLSECIHKTGC